MGKVPGSIFSEILRKRLETLGYQSLKKFHADRTDLGLSYEVLRQVIYVGRTPRSETLLRILQAMRFTPAQVRKIMELSFGGLYRPDQKELFAGEPPPEEAPPEPGQVRRKSEAEKGSVEAAAPPGYAPEVELDEPGEIAALLARLLPKIPRKGNEDFWELTRHLARCAERKVQDLARRRADQPLLFETEPEAIYQFLVRGGRVVPYMSKGDTLHLAFVDGIDYRDRFRGALLGAAIGDLLGRPAQGLSARDVAELYGRIDERQIARQTAAAPPDPPAFSPLARLLASRGKYDPKELAGRYAAFPATAGPSGTEFARNVLERGYPWFEAGSSAPEAAPAVRVVPLSLAHAKDFRRLKLEAGIDAAVTHPSAVAVAGAIAQAAAVARLLHTPPGTLDVIGFGRALSPVVAGIEPDRPVRARAGRPPASLFRRIGTDLPALLLRRAKPEEIAETLGNGPAAVEAIPFGWACFLSSPDDFASAVLLAANAGNEAQGTASIAGALAGAYLGARGVPQALLSDLPWKKELEGTADALLAVAHGGPR